MPRPKVIVVAAEGACMPEYRSEGAAGADLRAFLPEPVVLEAGERRAIPTGLCMEIPPNYEGQVRPRSGLALERGLTCLNSPGTLDSDYRGEIRVIMVNLGSEAAVLTNGDRIAQLVIAPVSRASFAPASSLGETGRGAGGFGSTGLK